MNSALTACMIAKNEGKSIRNAIASLQKVTDRIVLVDTGSDDNTPTIATSMGADVYFHLWNDDFAEARNFALSLVRTDWVLFLDADEVIDYKTFNEYFNYMNNQNIGGLSCKIINYLDNDLLKTSEHSYTRMFRSNINIRYRGRIHEQIAESILEGGLKIVDTQITIFHYGYINTSTEKKLRNRDMLSRELKSGGGDFELYHLANTEFSLSNFIRAKELFLRLLDSKLLTYSQHETILIRLLQIALSLDDYDYILHNASYVFDNKDYEGLKYFIMSAYYLHCKEFTLAKSFMQKAIDSNSNLVNTNLIGKMLNNINNSI